MALFNLARMTVSSTGTGTITLNAAVSGFLTFDAAGCSTAAAGQPITYAIGDTTQSEIASGTYFSSSVTLTRGSSTSGLKSTNSNSPIAMTSAAQVIITPQAAGIVGRIVTQGFINSGTYTPTTGLIAAVLECVGGGGGGAGVPAVSLAILGAGGGGGGSYGRIVALSSAIGASQTVTVGAGGAGGVGGAIGSSGGTTSVGTLVNAPGGSAAPATIAGTAPVGGAGGVVGSASGQFAIPGESGLFGFHAGSADASTFFPTGAGGGTFYGPGAASAVFSSGPTSSANGVDATVPFGGGGSGGGAYSGVGAVNGGAGSKGFAFITEYCSL